MNWKMVWEDNLIGFTMAGFVAVLVPAWFCAGVFVIDAGPESPTWLVALENAAVAPFVAAATFIGSMRNFPLATVLNANGVMFVSIVLRGPSRSRRSDSFGSARNDSSFNSCNTAWVSGVTEKIPPITTPTLIRMGVK